MSWQQNCSKALKNWLLLLQEGEDCIGCAGIKASCWLIQKKDWWLCDELHPNVGSLPFPSRHSSDQFGSYLQAEEIRYLQQDLVSVCSGGQSSPHPAALFIFRVPLVNSRASSKWWVWLSVGDCVAVSRAWFSEVPGTLWLQGTRMTLTRKSQNEATAVRGGIGVQGCLLFVAHLLLKWEWGK